jgi:hypothetical protein
LIFPNQPSYFTKKQNIKRTLSSTFESRGLSHIHKQDAASKDFLDSYKILDINDLMHKLGGYKLPSS